MVGEKGLVIYGSREDWKGDTCTELLYAFLRRRCWERKKEARIYFTPHFVLLYLKHKTYYIV
jgi:hypothetical protein